MRNTVRASALAITDEHQDLAEAAIGQLTRLGTLAKARASLEGGSTHPPEIWSAATALGWTGLALSEDAGGSGFGLAELAVVLECPGAPTVPGTVPAERVGLGGHRPLRAGRRSRTTASRSGRG